MIAFLSLFFALVALIGYFSDQLFGNEPFHMLISAVALEQNSNQSEPLVNHGSIHDSNENSQNQSPDTDNQGNSGLASEDKPEIDSKNDPSQLKAILVGNTGKRHDLILFRYTTGEGSVSPSGATYPKKPRITFHSGDKVNLLSGNQYFKVVVYSMSLDSQNGNGNNNKNSKETIYLQKKGSKFVIPDVISGTFHLYIKAEYTPSDDDTAYFVDTVKIENGEKQSQSNSKSIGKVGNAVAEVKSKKVAQQHRMQLNISVQTTSFNQTVPSDLVFKVIANNNKSQYGNAKANVLYVPVLSQSTSRNITLVATSLNQTHPENKIIKATNTLTQPITLQDNKTIEAVHLNQTKPDDMILQLNASNLTMVQIPVTLQFIPVNQSLYKIEFLSANQTVTG